MVKKSSLMSKVLVFLLAFAVVFTYSVMPMNQAYAASAKKPAKVVIKTVKAASSSSVKVTWKKAKNAKKYEVWYSLKAKKGFKKAATVKSSKKTYTVKKLKAGKKYYFKVRAINGKKKGAFSAVKSATTKSAAQVIESDPIIGAPKTATHNVEIDMSKYDAGKVVKVWVPVPQSDEYQVISNESFTANKAKDARFTESEGNKMLYLEWGADATPADRTASLTYTAKRYDVSRKDLADNAKAGLSAEAKSYVSKESQYVNISDAIVKKYAAEAVKDVSDKNSTVEKARAIYEWVIANLARIDNGEKIGDFPFGVEGCGYGDTKKILGEFEKYGIAGGHCTDLNSTFVALCRANGIAAREMFGIRLGKDGENITGYQHCWAEFYLPGTGWVYADPADVLKAIKPDKASNNQIDVDAWNKAKASDLCKEKTEYFWGHVDNNRVVLSRGRDITFEPAQAWGVCNTFGYPAAEIGGERMPTDFTDGAGFKYTITSGPVLPDFVNMSKEDWATYGTSELKDEDVLIDVRDNDTFKAGHLNGSKNITVSNPYTQEQMTALKSAYDAASGKRIVLVCYSGNLMARNGMAALQDAGADMSKVTYLIGGANGAKDKWVKYIDLEGDDWAALGIASASLTDDDFLVDVRDADTYKAGHLAGSQNVTVSNPYTSEQKAALKNAYDAAAGKRIVLVCYSGNKMAKNGMEALDAAGADMTKVTYLIDGANGVKDKWVKYLDMGDTDWAAAGIAASALTADDVLIDVRDADTFKAGHLAGSQNITVSNPYTSDEQTALKNAYDAADGKRIVLVCYSGNKMARNGMDALNSAGADMTKVTYLIGGANGVTDKLVTE